MMLALGLSLVLASTASATRSQLNDVNDICGTNYGCGICHVDPSGGGGLTSEGQAYSDAGHDPCYFCDSVCHGPTDGDGDGFTSDVDCNDADASIYPGATEICDDRKDNDCNGFIDAADDACGTLSCTDFDGDGFSVEGGDCGPVDCVDDDADIYPGADDVCGDGIDQDCSGKDRTKGKGCFKSASGGKGPASEGKGKTCWDGIDNDGDGLTDCDDDDCTGSRVCR